MTDIKAKAQEMLLKVQSDYPHLSPHTLAVLVLERTIERHEAFKQEVSDALLRYFAPSHVPHGLKGFIIKPDPLVEVLDAMKDGRAGPTTESHAACLRAALDACGLEIREKNNDQ